jgi:hypothetical protein
MVLIAQNIKTTGMALVLLAFIACSTTKTSPTTTATSAVTPTTPVPVVPKAVTPFVQWDKKKQDIGKVKRGEKRTLFFEFTNTSGEEIKIEIVDACECTKVEYPHRSIAPGGKGRLDVTFDSKDKEAAETIGINVVFTNIGPDGNPRIEVVEYQFDLEK